jgi:hypothetical protein
MKRIKQNRRDATLLGSLLSNDVLLRLVLAYAAPQSWAFIACVSKQWVSCCRRLNADQVANDGHLMPRTAETTYSAAVQSESRLRLALAWGVNVNQKQIQYAAGRHATIHLLHRAFTTYGMHSSTEIACGAAATARLDVLDWLFRLDLTHDRIKWAEIGTAAVVSGSIAAVDWAYQHGAFFSSEAAYTAVRNRHTDVFLTI